jgi:hypothetical protein
MERIAHMTAMQRGLRTDFTSCIFGSSAIKTKNKNATINETAPAILLTSIGCNFTKQTRRRL